MLLMIFGAGCASHGTNFNESHISEIKRRHGDGGEKSLNGAMSSHAGTAKNFIEREEYDLKFDGAHALERSNHIGDWHAKWIGMADIDCDFGRGLRRDKTGGKDDESGRRRKSSGGSYNATGKVSISRKRAWVSRSIHP